MTTRSTPMRPASRIVLRVTSSCRRPASPGCTGLPEQLSALIPMPCASSRARKSRRAGALSSSRSSSMCGAVDQLPQPNSSMSISRRAATAEHRVEVGFGQAVGDHSDFHGGALAGWDGRPGAPARRRNRITLRGGAACGVDRGFATRDGRRGGIGYIARTMLANFILFQLGWFACVLGGAHDRPWLGAGGGDARRRVASRAGAATGPRRRAGADRGGHRRRVRERAHRVRLGSLPVGNALRRHGARSGSSPSGWCSPRRST